MEGGRRCCGGRRMPGRSGTRSGPVQARVRRQADRVNGGHRGREGRRRPRPTLRRRRRPTRCRRSRSRTRTSVCSGTGRPMRPTARSSTSSTSSSTTRTSTATTRTSPSDLEQMPHLLNFLKDNGTLFTNDHTILISHTAGGILQLADRPLPGPAGTDGLEQLRLLPGVEDPGVHAARSSTGRTRSTRPTTRCRTWSPTGRRRRPRRGCRSRAPAVTSAASAPRTSSSRTRARRPRATSPRCSARTRPSGTRPTPTRRPRRPTSSASRSTARRRRRASATTTATRNTDALPGRARRLHGLQGPVRREVRRSGHHRRQGVRARHERRLDHRSGRPLRLPGLRRDARAEHARLRRGDAGERRAGDVRLHLGRARPARPDARERLVHELGDGPGRDRPPAAAEGLRHGVRRTSSRTCSSTGSTSRTRCS